MIEPYWSKRFDERWCPEPNTGCWLWTGGTGTQGYGQIRILGKKVSAHRASFYRAHGRWPVPVCCHRCDTPACVNPDHLFEGTQLANMRDREAKGRGRYAGRTHCYRGHEYCPENTWIRGRARDCKLCQAINRAAKLQDGPR